jgi:hypothetical protein
VHCESIRPGLWQQCWPFSFADSCAHRESDTDLTRLHFGSLLASVVLAVILLALLFVCTDLDLAVIGRLLLGMRPQAFGEILLLTGFNCFLSGEKWRLIAMRLRQDDGRAMPRLLYFAFTSIGVALGQIVPVQFSLVLSRSIGAHLYGGRALSRGATATLFDYFFDVLVAAFLGLSSMLVLISGGGAITWALCTLLIGIAGFVLYGAAARLVVGALRLLGRRGCGRFHGFCTTTAVSPLLAPDIGRRLLAISGLRFTVLVLVGAVSANAVALDVPIWRLAASMPFAIIANALAITPGGLGITEWAVSSALFALGTQFQVSAQWAVVNRVLVAAAAGLCGVAGALIAAAARSSRTRRVV